MQQLVADRWQTVALCLLPDPDFKAETVTGITLRRLTGAGTVPLHTLQGNKSDYPVRRKNSKSSGSQEHTV